MVRRARQYRKPCAVALVLSAALALAACNSKSGERAPALAEAYVGPAKLQLRAELVARSGETGAVKHGDRVEIIGRRRRFVKVRTSNGEEGWVDSLQLLDPRDMDSLRALGARAAAETSQGSATTFEPLNAHTAPNRMAPSFFQITPETRVEVIAHQKAPRVAFEPPAFLAEMAGRAKKAREERVQSRKKKRAPAVPPPPRGPAPAVPRDWVAMSGYPEGPPPPPPPPPAPPSVMDSWSLVRTREGLAGWALTRMLYMTIPDDVAQYAERARITSFFALDTVHTKSNETRHHWLWTTLRSSGDHQFDNLRVFTFNQRRDRYETSYIERDIKGWLPIHPKWAKGGRVTGWTVVVEEKDGSIQEREYSWSGERARIVGRKPAKPPEAWYTTPGARGVDADSDEGDSEAPTPGWGDRIRAVWRSITGRSS